MKPYCVFCITDAHATNDCPTQLKACLWAGSPTNETKQMRWRAKNLDRYRAYRKDYMRLYRARMTPAGLPAGRN